MIARTNDGQFTPKHSCPQPAPAEGMKKQGKEKKPDENLVSLVFPEQ